MNKQEAIAAMKLGAKVTHRFFTQNEFVTITPAGWYLFEDGVMCSPLSFWYDRTGQAWEEDWTFI